MKKVLLSLLLLSSLCIAQNPVDNLGALEQTARVQNDLKYTVDGIDGHQYFLDDWGSGKIIINDSINAFKEKIQFDMVSGEPIIGNKYNNKKGFILRDKSVSGFVINNTTFVKIPSNMFLTEVEREYFITPIFSKNNYFLADYSKILKEPFVLKNSYNDANPNKKYITLKRYYILNKNNKYVSIKLKKKAILTTLSDKKVALKNYVKTQGLSFKKENDVAELLTYYHSL
jgi:hypothetical protein|tara:strand:- start:263 stop:949 length:687 start_codon:yes stop_codon:yes gene_type:complete